MKQGWTEKTLKEIGNTQTGTTPKTSDKENYGDFIPFIKPADIDIQDNGEVRYDNDGLSKKGIITARKIPKGSVLMVCIGATIGKVGFVDRDVSCNQQINTLTVNKDFDPKFFYYALSTPNFYLDVIKNSAQATLPIINKSKWENLTIKYPEQIKEQQRIVSILDEAFANISKAKDNAEQNLKNAKELFESYLQGVFTDKGDDWEEKTLGEVLLKTETIDPTKKPNEEFIYLDVSAVNKDTKEIKNSTVMLGKDAPSRARKLIKTNDVIFATVRPTHSRVALITEEYNEQVCSTGYFVLRAKEFLNNGLVYYFLLTYDFNKQMEKLQKGASYPAVTDAEVKSVFISYPKSKKSQEEIIKKLDELSVQTKRLEAIYEQKLNDLEELKKSILQKAFNGEL